MITDPRIQSVIDATQGKDTSTRVHTRESAQPSIVTDDLPLPPCDCRRCFALSQPVNSAQEVYLRGPFFAELRCPRDPDPIAVVLQRLADIQLAHTALASRLERLEEKASQGARFPWLPPNGVA